MKVGTKDLKDKVDFDEREKRFLFEKEWRKYIDILIIMILIIFSITVFIERVSITSFDIE